MGGRKASATTMDREKTTMCDLSMSYLLIDLIGGCGVRFDKYEREGVQAAAIRPPNENRLALPFPMEKSARKLLCY